MSDLPSRPSQGIGLPAIGHPASPSSSSTSAPEDTSNVAGPIDQSKHRAIIFQPSGNSEWDKTVFTDTDRLTVTITPSAGNFEPTKVSWLAQILSSNELRSIATSELRSMSRRQSREDGFLSASNGAIELNLAAFEKGRFLAEYRNLPTVLSVNWTRDGSEMGYTFSDVFAISTDNLSDMKNATGNVNNAQSLANFQSDDASSSSPNGGSGSGTDVGGESRPSTSSVPAKSYHHKGLSTGAIAGIGVGAGIAGLIIIMGLIWLVFRHRRKSSVDTDYEFSEGNKSSAFLSDHRQSDTAVVAYSDRQQPGYLSTAHQHEHPPTQPAKNPVLSTNATEVPSESADEIPSSVAHLVEDGMTSDDIRRLEEEERHLDAEIERNAKDK